MTRVLLVDDDRFTRELAAGMLVEEGFAVEEAGDGQEALELATREKPDVMILDIVMPEMDGFQLCDRIRADPFLANLPVIFLTSKQRPEEVARGLDAGGDDFVTKSRAAHELPARIRALLRRAGGILDDDTEHLSIGKIQLHASRPELLIDGNWHLLTPTQYRLLRYLMTHAGQPVSIDQLLEAVWGYPKGTGDPKLVRVHIAQLRRKIEPDLNAPRHIVNVRGRGYLVAG